MNYYSDFIKNKSVIFVGACPNLLDKNEGEFIDSHDIIVRSNGSFEIQDKYKKDYGSRTDVLYCNVQYAREMYPLPFKKYRDNGIKWICFKSLSEKHKQEYSPYLPVRDIKEVIEKVHKVVPGALMGLFIFQDILNCNPKSLTITGIDFFKSKKQIFEVNNYQEYLDGYLPPKIIAQGNIINVGKTKDGHNQLTNTKYIYDLWKEGKILMPDFIKDIMLGIVNEAI